MPPLVCFNWANEDGVETINRGEHYGERAAGGTGLIVVEATAISVEAKLTQTEIGLWNTTHLPQFKNIAKACHDHNSLVIVQLVHAGYNGTTDPVYSASKVEKDGKNVEALTLKQIQTIKDDFIKSSVLAYEAGLDGVEIHGAHTYLLNQFTSSKINSRDDQYGGSLENRCRLPLEIVREVRKQTSDDFIIGYRFGVNDESFKEDIYLLQALDQASVDFFDVSAGFSSTEIQLPEAFEFSPITYMGVHLKDYTDKPVACVYGIKKPEQAHLLVEKYKMPMVAIGRGILADSNWSNKALNNEQVNICLACKPRCQFAVDGHNCPQQKKLKK